MGLGYSRPSQTAALANDRLFQKIAGLASFSLHSTRSRFLASPKVAVARQVASLSLGC